MAKVNILELMVICEWIRKLSTTSQKSANSAWYKVEKNKQDSLNRVSNAEGNEDSWRRMCYHSRWDRLEAYVQCGCAHNPCASTTITMTCTCAFEVRVTHF